MQIENNTKKYQNNRSICLSARTKNSQLGVYIMLYIIMQIYEKQTNYVCAALYWLFFCRGYLRVVLTQINWFLCFVCKLKSSVFLGITLCQQVRRVAIHITHLHTFTLVYSDLHSRRHVIIFVFPSEMHWWWWMWHKNSRTLVNLRSNLGVIVMIPSRNEGMTITYLH